MTRPKLDQIVDRTFARFSLGAVLHELRVLDANVFLVGGAVRDALRNPDLAPVDIDLMTTEDFNTLQSAFRSLGTPRVNRHGNQRYLLKDGRHLDLIHTRRFYGRAATVEEALRHFDASVNALGVSVNGRDSILDPLNGVRDLRDGRLTLPSARWVPSDPFEDVHVLLRTIRLVERTELRVANPDLASSHRRRFGEVDWVDLQRLNGFGRDVAERKYDRIFSDARDRRLAGATA
ncbi:hypothetical protein MIC448_230002 [Microbacterium sp. C448]|uniref:hypothetical protein n=1 Tax=Microbacterium sp. C448 TaxID=1177594 RepID=UPI0003DE0063|nr:hypothetical protein [Microbacterium sp. C448]CDK00259.1 hypothetical protein MIC448_230002 [Microbacterium sp. C448]